MADSPSAQAPLAILTGGQGDLAQATRGQLQAQGWKVEAPGREELDVLSSESTQRYFEPRPAVDLLICFAGVAENRLLARQNPAAWQHVIDTNLRGAMWAARAVSRGMARRRNGTILFIGSQAALDGPIGQSAYAAAKAGLHGLAKSLAAELGPRNVRVNVVHPGWLETKMTAALPQPVKEAAQRAHALGRFTPVSEAARFLAALPSFATISGQIFHLDSRLHR
ncbi:MAG: SDR family NAD(P)-dependent oxidoreductase [Verrucomicrobiota bacterium]